MENSRFCPHPDIPERIVPYSKCAVCQFNTTPVKTGLYNSVRFMTEVLPDSVLVLIDKVSDIVQSIQDFQPDFVFAESIIIEPSLLSELVRQYPAKYVIRIHSKIPFLAAEGDALKNIIQYYQTPGVIVSINNEECNHDFINAGIQTTYLPNIYNLVETDHVVKPINDTIDIGCFGAFRWFKNQLQQAFNSIHFAKKNGVKLRFHINENRIEKGGDGPMLGIKELFKFADAELICHPWMDHDVFKSVIRDMHLGVQFSLTESFNIVTADFISQNVPVAVTKEIKFVSPQFKANPIDSDAIIMTMQNAIDGVFAHEHLNNNILLKEYNTEATRIWREFLCL